MNQPLFPRQTEQNESWITVSDLMAGLMMVFLVIAVIYAKDSEERRGPVERAVKNWIDVETQIYVALKREFRRDLWKWNAEIEKETLTIRFRSPDILFESGDAELTPYFQAVLDDFIPRYLELLYSRFEEPIEEIRIEGHTSSEWFDAETQEQAFILNMALSQARTRAVLSHALQTESLHHLTSWIVKTVSANGLSSARLVVFNGIEDKTRSRRVEFVIRTNAKRKLFEIIRGEPVVSIADTPTEK